MSPWALKNIGSVVQIIDGNFAQIIWIFANQTPLNVPSEQRTLYRRRQWQISLNSISLIFII